DRCTLDAEHLADERGEPCHRASLLTAEDGCELLGLLVRRLVVDEHPEAPVTLRHHLRAVCDHGELDAADIRALNLAFADVEDERYPAVVVGRAVVERQVARAHELARARLEVAPLDAPGHTDLPFSRRW